jgi:hypothetical protein
MTEQIHEDQPFSPEAARALQEIAMMRQYEALLASTQEYAGMLAQAGFSTNQVGLQRGQIEEHLRQLRQMHPKIDRTRRVSLLPEWEE